VAGWISALLLIAIALGVVWLYRSVRFGAIVSESMEPTLQAGDYYMIRIDAYRREGPQHGDVVVTKNPDADEERELLVKRVVAVGGDSVAVMEGRVWLNGHLVDEPYLRDQQGVRERPVYGVVPEAHVILLGDNRNASEDSRDFGAVPADKIIGRVTAVLLPWKHRRSLDAPAPPE
jgi:signal peptidase I